MQEPSLCNHELHLTQIAELPTCGSIVVLVEGAEVHATVILHRVPACARLVVAADVELVPSRTPSSRTHAGESMIPFQKHSTSRVRRFNFHINTLYIKEGLITFTTLSKISIISEIRILLNSLHKTTI